MMPDFAHARSSSCSSDGASPSPPDSNGAASPPPPSRRPPKSALKPSSNGANGNATVASKICGVCGDHALGFNFDAVSCESCKAFFRRNALRVPSPRCLFAGACHIDANTRRFCQRCRLDKCFAIGMKKEWILNDEEKKRRKQKILDNKIKKERLQHPEGPQRAPQRPHSLLPGSKRHRVEEDDDGAAANERRAAFASPKHLADSTSEKASRPTSRPTDRPTPPPQFCPFSPQDAHRPPHRRHLPPPPPCRDIDAASPPLPPRPSSAASSAGSTPTSVISASSPASPSLERRSEPRITANRFVDFRRDWSPSDASSVSSLEVEDSGAAAAAASAAAASAARHFERRSFDYDHRYSQQPGDPATQRLEAMKREIPPPSTPPPLTPPPLTPLSPSPPKPLPPPTPPSATEVCRVRRYLTDTEVFRLERLVAAFESTEVRLEDDERRDATSLQDFVNKTEGLVRRIIKFAKRIDAFHELGQADQVALLKGAILEIIILRSAIYYDPAADALHQNGFVFKMELLKRLLNADDLMWRRHTAFVKSLRKELRCDRKTLLLVIAVALFSPDHPNVADREGVADRQEAYLLLLKHHLENTTSFGETVYLLPELLAKLGQLRSLCQEHSKLLSPIIKRSQLEPLMVEMFDVRVMAHP